MFEDSAQDFKTSTDMVHRFNYTKHVDFRHIEFKLFENFAITS